MEPEVTQRFERVEVSLDEARTILNQLAVRQAATDATIGHLVDLTNALIQTIDRQAEQAERDRNQAAIDREAFQTSVRDILSYLRERYNGHRDE
jgi:hypothetical protein